MSTATAPLPSSSSWAIPQKRVPSSSTPSSSSSLLVRNGSFVSFQFGQQNSPKCKLFSSSPSSCGMKLVGVRGAVCSAATAAAGSSAPPSLPAALLFDCDGVLVDTEKDGHRISFNDTFAEVIDSFLSTSFDLIL